MHSNRILKFKAGFPFNLESKLVNRFGYAVEQRIYGQYCTFRYSPKETVVSNVSPLFPVGLTATRQTELMKRCDNIVEFFPDPYNQERAIRTRLHNMSQTLPRDERQFVQDYMDDNFPSHDKGI